MLWLENELNGYHSESKIPPYREIRGVVRAWNPYQGWIPLVTRDAELAEKLSTRKICQPISQIESLLSLGSGGRNHFEMPFSPETEYQLMASANARFRPTLHVQHSQLQGIIDAVKTAVLKWALQLEQDGIKGEGLTFSTNEKQMAQAVNYNVLNFYGTVTGSQIQQGSNNSSQEQ